MEAAVADVRREAEPIQGHVELTCCLAWLAGLACWHGGEVGRVKKGQICKVGNILKIFKVGVLHQ